MLDIDSMKIWTVILTLLPVLLISSVYGATTPIPFTYDMGSFTITDLSIKDDDYSPSIIGFIENTDPSLTTIKGVKLKIEMYDRNNHLIDVTDSGYSALPDEFPPHYKSAFKLQIDKNNDLHHINIRILASDWGTPSSTYPSDNSYSLFSNSSIPYLGINGIDLTPDLSKQIGLNETKGVLIASITEGSPAEKTDLQGGTIIKIYNGREILTGGDIILKIDNQSVSKTEDMPTYVAQKHAGDKVNLTISRDNAIKNVEVILGKKPNQPSFQNNNVTSTEGLYDECVRVAGESYCDFLFRRN